MNYNNPENPPIVGEENSHSELKNEIIEEGHDAKLRGEDKSSCKYAEDSTFYKWWMHGYKTCMTF